MQGYQQQRPLNQLWHLVAAWGNKISGGMIMDNYLNCLVLAPVVQLSVSYLTEFSRTSFRDNLIPTVGKFHLQAIFII